MAGADREAQRKRGMRALEGKAEEEVTGERRDWTDCVAIPRDQEEHTQAACMVKEKWENIWRKRQKGNKESRALLQLNAQIPSDYPQAQVGSVIAWNNIRKLGRNIMAKAMNSVVARLMKPANVQIQTADSTNFEQDQAAIAATKACKGLDANNNALQVETRMVRNGWQTHKGKGYALWEPDGRGNLRLRWLDPFYTWVSEDTQEAVLCRFMPRRQAMAQWGTTPEAREAIKTADVAYPEVIEGVDDTDEVDIEDKICIWEAFYEYAEGEGKNAKTKVWHVVQLAPNACISHNLDMAIHPVWWIDCIAGFRDGQAAPSGRNVAPYHYWINSLQQNLWHQLVGQKVHIVAEAGTKFTKPSDVNYQVIRHSKGRKPPVITMPDTVSQHIERNIENLEAGALAEVGSSEGAAEGTLPGGVTSGIAITKYQNEVAIALSEHAANLNIGRVRSAKIKCYYMSALYKDKVTLVKAENSDDLEAIKWPALNMAENTWSVTVATVGALPDTVAGKQQVLDWFAERGVVLPEHIAEAFDNPDIDRILGEVRTPRRLIRKQISMCLNMSPPRIFGPDGTQDPKLGLKLVGLAYQDARIRGKFPRANMDALFRLYQLFKDRVDQQAPAGGVATVGASAAEMGVPGGGMSGAGVPGAVPATAPGADMTANAVAASNVATGAM